MRPNATPVMLLVLAALFSPVAAFAQTPPDTTAAPPPAAPAPVTTPPPSAPAPAPVTTPAPAAAAPTKLPPTVDTNNYWFTLSGSASLPHDSFGERAEMGSQFLGGLHRRMWDRLSMGLTFGASNWAGVDIQSYHDIQITLDARYHLTRTSRGIRPFVQVGFGSYQMVSEAEVQGVEPERASENSWGLNYGGGLLFSIGGSALLGPVVLYHTAGQIPEIGNLVGAGDVKFVSVGLELVLPMGR